MNRSWLIFGFTSAVLVIVTAVVTFLFDNPDLVTWLVCLLALLGIGLLFWQWRAASISEMRQIERLAGEIDACIQADGKLIEASLVPKRIRPLVQSLNNLLKYESERYEQERNFSADASHELRTPLAGIQLQAEIALRSDAPEQREKALKNILKAIERATRLVEQLLILSRLTVSHLELTRQLVAMDRVCEQVLAVYYDVIQGKNIHLRLEKPDTIFNIVGDSESLAIMLDNLVRNAVAYTPDGGSIEVKLINIEGHLRITVTDSGPGIRPDQRTRVLVRFQKADGARKSGTGIGLAIVNRIVQLHHGKLALHDAHWGGGLAVSVDLPFAMQ